MKNLIFLLLFVTSFGYATNPPINNPSPLAVCDDNNDGFSCAFELGIKNVEILGALNAANYSVTYHETLTDAQVGMSNLPNLYCNIFQNVQTVYVRVVETATGDFSTTSLDLIVNSLPVVMNPLPPYFMEGISGVANFNLTSQIPMILMGQTGCTVRFFNDPAFTNQIIDTFSVTNMANPQIIFVTITNDATGCFSFTTLDLIVTNLNPFPINNPSPLNICDEDFNGFGVFDLLSKNAEILGVLPAADYTVTYYETLTNANIGANPIPFSYTNITNPQTVYVRVVENATNSFSITNLQLIVNAQPNLISPIPSLNAYETPTDGIAQFNLSLQGPIMVNGPMPPGIIITYHLTQADALTGANSIAGATNFTGNDQQVIWVNVRYAASDCQTVSSFVLRVIDSANLIVFPDANFKAKLLSSSPTNPVGMFNAVGVTIDANADGEIQFSEALTINSLNVSNSNIGDMTGIGYFTNLQLLDCNQNHITSLDVTGTSLLSLSCAENALSSLILTGLPSNFAALDCHQNQLFDLDLTGFIGLYALDCHANHLTSLNTSDLLSANSINCSENMLDSLSFSNLLGLEKLNCGNNVGLSSLTLNNLPVLKELYVYGTVLGSLNVTAFPTLEILDCNVAHLNTLNVTGLTNLTHLNCNFNQLSTVNTSTLTSLEQLSCGSNLLTNLDLSANPNLQKLYCWQNTISTLNLSNLSQLNEVDCQNNGMTSLQLGTISGLQQIHCNYNNLTTLDVSHLANLTILNCWDNSLSTLDVSQNPNLQYVYCSANLFTTLDFTVNTNLNTISVFNNPNLQSLFIKNGTNELNQDSLLNCPNLIYICADEYQIAAIQSSNPLVTVNTFCSFVPGGNYNTVTGTASLDMDNNGCNGSDPTISFLNLGIQLNGTATLSSLFTNTNGVYNLYTSQPGVYQLTPIIENPLYFNVSPVEVPVTTIDNSSVTQNICISANGIHPDLEVVLAPITPARPGFDATYKLVFKNKGNQTLSGTVTFNYNDNVLDLISASTPPTSQSTGVLSWNYSNLLPFEKRSFQITLNVNSPVETPPVFNGSILSFTTSISPIPGDETPIDNTFVFNQTVVGSYDPNDITCLQGTVVSPSEIGNYLHYVINFENTGTFYAENVVVQDIIDTSKYDISSLQILNASHPMSARINENKVEFIFEGINLAAVGGNPPVGGHGNVLFKIKSKGSLVANDFVQKNANIYFDYNAPITTNVAQTVFALLSNTIVVADQSVALFPNPAHHTVTIQADSSIESVELFDIQGRILEKSFQSSNSVTLDVSNRQNGIYFLKITTEKGSKVERLVKK